MKLNSDENDAGSHAAYINYGESFFSVRANTIGALNHSMPTHLCDENQDFEHLKALGKERREQEKQQGNDEDAKYAARSEAYQNRFATLAVA